MRTLKNMLPPVVFTVYHRALASIGAFWYGNPSKRVRVVAVTGTKGKSSVCELLNGVLESAGYNTAVVSTIRFKIGETSTPNKLKMTMPGRFFLQKFMRQAVDAGCDWVIVEMTSEGAKQFRHIGIHMDALIFTNIEPEHIESHGSFENYLNAKLSIGKALVRSDKRPRTLIANADDEHGSDFLALPVDDAVPYSLTYAQPYTTTETGTTITFDGVEIHSPMPGEFTMYNMLATALFAQRIGIDTQTIRIGLENTRLIPGRVEPIDLGQDFDVIVDYAHTPESLQKLYEAFPNRRKICVLGNTGGGRDTWKRPKMGAIAEQHCERVILTDEDPYDEDPEAIVNEMAAGMSTEPHILMDRRAAIRYALNLAKSNKGDAVLITGKGTDPYIMRAGGVREAWSDAQVTREELERLFGKKDDTATI